MKKHPSKLSWFLRISIALVASVMLFLPAYSSGYSAYAATNTTTANNDNDDQNKPGFGIPGIGGSGSGLPGSGTTGTIQNGSTIGLGTIVTNPNTAATSIPAPIITGVDSSKQAQLQKIQQEFETKITTVHLANGKTIRSFTDRDYEISVLKIAKVQTPNKALSIGKKIKEIIKKAPGKGQNKIIWHGKISKGNVDIYLSSGVLKFLRSAGTDLGVWAVLTGLLWAIGGPAGGLFAILLRAALSQIVKLVIKEQFKKIKHGQIFKVRHWKKLNVISQ